MSELGLKTGIAVGLLFMGFASALAPRFAMAISQNVFSLGNMFASGILLCTGLVHLLPEAQEVLNEKLCEYPWGGFICGSSFSLLLVFEEVMHMYLQSEHNHEHEAPSDKGGMQCRASIRSSCPSKGFLGTPADQQYQIFFEDDHVHEKIVVTDSCHVDQPYQNSPHQKIQFDSHNRESWSSTMGRIRASIHSVRTSISVMKSEHHHHEEAIEHHLHGSAVSSIVLMFALSIHSILAGVTLGTDETAISSTAIAIITHKFFDGYALGSTLTAAADSIRPSTYIAMISIFSFCTPVGIMVGAILSSQFVMSPITVACLKAAVGGTFLYISIVEVGMKELLSCRAKDGDSKFATKKSLEMAKLLSFVLGYAVMAILAIYV